jgi:hypothetical protein
MSQRESDFKGGIQNGTTAFDTESKRLDVYLKENRQLLRSELDGFKVVNRFSKQLKESLVGDDCFGFEPDGGAWFKDGKLVAVFEAKKQGEQGNAYERWWDNATTAKFINPDVKYVTFCTGAGAAEDKCLDKLRRKAKIMMGENFETHCKVEPFTEQEVRDIMRETLMSI